MTSDRAVKGMFGFTIPVIADIWERLLSFQLEAERTPSEPEHLLWALRFLRVYDTDDRSATFWRRDHKTLSKHMNKLFADMLCAVPFVRLFLFIR